MLLNNNYYTRSSRRVYLRSKNFYRNIFYFCVFLDEFGMLLIDALSFVLTYQTPFVYVFYSSDEMVKLLKDVFDYNNLLVDSDIQVLLCQPTTIDNDDLG